MMDEGLEQRIEADLKAALRAGDEEVKMTLRGLKAAIKNAEIEGVKDGRLALGARLDEAAVEAVLRQQAKQRRDAIALYQQGGRAELAEREQRELAIIEAYLPQPPSEAEIEAVARELIATLGAQGPADMGRVMGPVIARFGGRADGKTVSGIVRRLLAG